MISEDSRSIGVPFALFLIGAGAFILLAVESVVVVADRTEGTLRLRSRRFLGGRSAVVRLDEIQSVETPSWLLRGTESFSVVLNLAGNREQSLTRTPLFTAMSAERVARAIRKLQGGSVYPVNGTEEPLPICPRQVLKRVLARAGKLGVVPMCGMEYEWFNFAETPQSWADKKGVGPTTITPGMFVKKHLSNT